jgi:sugar lactone lactonase YvrE
MSKLLQLRGGTTTEHATFTGALREVTVDTTKDTLVVHDGATAGGFPLLKDADIGTTVEAYDATILKDADIGVSVSPAFLVGSPTITSPATGAVDFNGEITASAYTTIAAYTGTHDLTRWELSYTSDFAIIELESTAGNITTWTPFVGIALQQCYVRLRYSSDSHLSGYSDSISFTTTNTFINTPTLTVEGTPTDVPAAPTLSTGAYSVSGGTTSHASTDWQVIRDSDSVVVWSSLVNTVNKLSIVVPAGIMVESIAYTFKARHTGVNYGSSAYVSVAGTAISQFPYDNYLSTAHTGTPYVTIFGNDVDTSTKLADPATLPTGGGKGVAFSGDGTYMAVGHLASPYITIYKRSGDTFTKLADPASLPSGAGMGIAFSQDGVYMSVAVSTTPYIANYKRSGDTFTKLADPATLPTGPGNGAALSADGIYMSITHNTTPFVTNYSRSGDTFTKITNPATLPGGNGQGIAFSPSSTYMAVAHESSWPYIAIYKRSGSTFTKLANPVTGATGGGHGVAFSPSSTYMAVAHSTSPYITIYKRSGDTFTKLANPATLPTGVGNGVAFSADGVYMSVAHSTSPYITVYKRSGDTFTKLADPAALPASHAFGIAYYPGVHSL